MSYGLCLWLTVLMLLVTCAGIVSMFLPLVNLAPAGEDISRPDLPIVPLGVVRLALSVPFWIAVFLWALGCLTASWYGRKWASKGESGWNVLMVLSGGGALAAMMLAFVVPKFVHVFRDLGMHL